MEAEGGRLGGATGPWSPPGGRLRARRSQRGRRPAAARSERTGGSSRRGSRARLRSVQFVKTTAARDDEGLESTEQVAGTAALRTPARSTARRGDRAKRWSGQWQEGLGGAAESAQGLGTPAAWHGAGAASGRPRRAPRPRRTTELDASGGVLERASPCSTKRKRRPARREVGDAAAAWCDWDSGEGLRDGEEVVAEQFPARGSSGC